ncbi:hypothetical protein NPIL_262481 [Nephila pilipes]|uniref:Uncharacterized protein n=1 Tax=Nephila pilipes TaxID=299642 RepID=A0A8X6PYE1_NEPPI|nr:hypothetical protein NPIL_262481 [Nephila pilipes]
MKEIQNEDGRSIHQALCHKRSEEESHHRKATPKFPRSLRHENKIKIMDPQKNNPITRAKIPKIIRPVILVRLQACRPIPSSNRHQYTFFQSTSVWVMESK